MNPLDSTNSDLKELVNALAARLADGENSPETTDSHRELAKACLQMILSRGYEINLVGVTERATSDRESQIAGQGRLTADAVAIFEKLKQPGSLPLRDVLALWRQTATEEFVGPAMLYATIGERVLKAGEPLIAYDILNFGLKHSPNNIRLHQLLALALARSGATLRAAERLKELVSAGHDDEETLSLLARTCKDLWETQSDPQKKIEHLREAQDLYRQGYRQAVESGSTDGALYAGINAATISYLLDEPDVAVTLAKEVADFCRKKLQDETDYWALATLGECALIRGRLDQAATHYASAVEAAGNNFADLASTRRNATFLLQHMGENTEILKTWFPMPKIAVFTGHLIDHDDSSPRFPHDQIDNVREQLCKLLVENNVGIGYSAAACGGDLLFVQALEQVAGEGHIVLPMGREQFIRESVAVDQTRDWLPDFAHAMNSAAHVSIVNEFSRKAEPLNFEYANHVMTGLAMLHSQSLGAEIVPIAVWDEQPARGPGGTASLVEFWKRLGWEPLIVNPLGPVAGRPIVSRTPAMTTVPQEAESQEEFWKETCALLFADVVGYSKITEEEIPLFVREFMGRIAGEVAKMDVTIETGNTWGDAIYFVFQSVEAAGLTALRITELINSIDWEAKGFARQLSLRIGLHVGPVYRFVDPVTKVRTHTGAHVSRAARIEPVTPPGEVYASEAFAAVAAAEEVASFRCDYVGVTPMAKGYGDFPTYHVRRT